MYTTIQKISSHLTNCMKNKRLHQTNCKNLLMDSDLKLTIDSKLSTIIIFLELIR